MTTILVADDDPDILELVDYKLSQSGYAVIAVSDGRQAIEHARKHHPALMILDVTMPFHSGIEVTLEMRTDPDLKNTPIILLTAKSMEQDTERGFAAGATDYMTKPFSPRELLSRVQAALGRTV
ncbi:MAG: response regulator [Actinomycetota bacterium]|jgi:DNA-binding response OmpR family regulator|nr:response regulator [Actinomycetota bacterium]